MTDHRFTITLLDGEVSVHEVGADRYLDLGPGPRLKYDRAQTAIIRALDAITRSLGYSNGDALDEKRMRRAFEDGDFSLQLNGSAREIRVAALHLQCARQLMARGLATDESDLRGRCVEVVALEGATDPYADYGFDADLSALEAVGALLAKWQEISDDLPDDLQGARTTSRDQIPRLREALGLAARDGKRPMLSLVITGVTGAGKSTFLNALLGRSVVPHASETCTATLLRLVYAPSRDQEGFTIKWRSAGDLKALAGRILDELNQRRSRADRVLTGLDLAKNVPIENLKQEAASQKEARRDRIEWLEQKMRAVQHAIQESRAPASKRNLDDVAKYSRDDADSCAEAVESLTVHLHHPLLQRVQLIDAPGLRDGDDHRQRVAISAFTGETAWLYLVPLEARSDDPMLDWALIRKSAHNDLGVLVLTKPDTQPADTGADLASVVRDRERLYRGFGWPSTVEWCSALTSARLAEAGTDGFQERFLRKAFEDAKVSSLVGLTTKAGSRALEDYAGLGFTDPLARSVFIDYALDAGRIPWCLRRTGAVLMEATLRKRVSNGREKLTGLVRSAQAEADDALRTIAEQKAALADLVELKSQVAAEQQRLSDAQARLAEAKNEKKEARAALQRSSDDRQAELNGYGKELVKELPEALTEEYAENYAWESRGARSFSVLNHVDKPMDERGTEMLTVLRSQANELMLAAGIKGSLARGGGGFSLIRPDAKSDGVIEDYEKFFELDSTTMARMAASAKSRGKRGAAQVHEAFVDAANAILAELEGAFDEWIAAKLGACEKSAAVLKRLQSMIQEKDPRVSHQVLDARRERVERHSAAFQSFLADLDRPAAPGKANVFGRAKPGEDGRE